MASYIQYLDSGILVGKVGKLTYFARCLKRITGLQYRRMLHIMEYHVEKRGEDHVVMVYLSGDRAKGKAPVFTIAGVGKNAVLTQFRALVRSALYYGAVKQDGRWYAVEKEDRKRPSDLSEISLVSAAIKGLNCIPCRIKPVLDVPYRRGSPAVSPAFVLEVYKVAADSIGRPDLYALVDQTLPKPFAWSSMGNASGLITNLENIVRDRIKIDVPSDILAFGLMRYLYRHGYRGKKTPTIPIEDLGVDNLMNMHVPWRNASGVSLSKTKIIEVDGVRVRFGPVGDKKTFFVSEVERILTIWEQIKLKKGDYRKISWPLIVSKIAEKAEIKWGDDDPAKVRIIFVVCLLKILVDRILHAPWFKFTRFRGMNGIGLKWGEGDAQLLAEIFHAWEYEEYFWIHGDVSKLDQSLKASVLLLFSLLSFLAYDRNDPLGVFLLCLLCWSADNTARKYVMWPDKLLRFIIGIMFSGEYGTSAGDTFTFSLLMECYFIYIYQQLKSIDMALAKEFWDDIKLLKLLAHIYGDDFFMCVRRKWRPWVNLASLTEYALKYWDFKIKPKVSKEVESFFTIIKNSKIVVDGVLYLKRYFILMRRHGVDYVATFKESAAILVKLGLSAEAILSPEDQLSRVHALMIDSHGTNDEVWLMLESYADQLLTAFPHLSGDDSGDDFAFFKKKLQDSGFDADDFKPLVRPTRSQVLDSFFPTSRLAIRRKLFFEERGVESMRSSSYM